MKKTDKKRAADFCVIIPTYNNDRTLKKTVAEALVQTPNVIVVNDGSTDRTPAVLKSFKGRIDTVRFEKNRGKGAALQAGFKRAGELGYPYAITIDSDGQHFPSDIPKFLKKLKPGEKVLMIGKRNMGRRNVPESSVFGRKFSNFWVWLETGLDVEDAQSGYRLYTVAEMNRFRFFTKRYDFEIESLVRWAWRGYPVRVVPIEVYYPPAGERVSHFNKFKDNLRLTLLNTALLTVLILCILPMKAFRKITKSVFFKI